MELYSAWSYVNTQDFVKIELHVIKDGNVGIVTYTRTHILLDNKFNGFVPRVLSPNRAKRYLKPIKKEVSIALTSLLFHENQLIRELAKDMQYWLE